MTTLHPARFAPRTPLVASASLAPASPVAFGAAVSLAAILSILAILALSGPSHAQSLYAMQGIGETGLPQRADSRGMGGTEVAVDVPSISGNPASIVFADRATFYGSFQLEWLRTEEPIGDTALVKSGYNGYISNLALIFPTIRGLSVGTGMLVDRRRAGLIERSLSTSDGEPYKQTLEANGNLLIFPALVGLQFAGIELGAGVDFQLVNSKLRWTNEFEEGSGFVGSDDLEKTTLWGMSWKVGAVLPLVGDRVSFGGWYSTSSDLNGTRTLERDDAVQDADDIQVDFLGVVPEKWAAGIQLKPFSTLQLAGDWVHENWAESGRRPGETETFMNVDRYSVGLATGTTRDPGFLGFPFRVGYRTENLHVLDSRNLEVREHVISAGTGYRLAENRGSVDFFAEYGWRGEQDLNQYYEQFVRFGITLSGEEKWGARRKPEEDENW